jgi:tetratricopeptide (TPR) repeat protein
VKKIKRKHIKPLKHKEQKSEQCQQAEQLSNLGLAFQKRGQIEEAIKCYIKSIQLNPNSADTCSNLGSILQEREKFEEAIEYHEKALRLNPKHAVANYNLGSVFQKKGQLEKARIFYDIALQINPTNALAYNNLGTIYFQEKGRLEQAITCYRKAIQINPNYSNAYSNLGISLQEKGLYDEALACYKKALNLSPSHAEAHFNAAVILLLNGNLKDGWQEYEWRQKTNDHLFSQRSFSKPLWNGTDIKGQTILLYAEQGFGDTLHFIRYAPIVSQHGATVIVECQKELASLLQNIEGVHQVIAYGNQLPYFDIYWPLLSLPLVFNTTLETIPSDKHYISADSILVEKWRDRLNHRDSKLKIGLVWAGNPAHKRDYCRSCSLDIFSSLFEIHNVVFYSLQKGKEAELTKNAFQKMNFIDYTNELNDFSDTAAFIENLDLVISVDTSVAHLAGALGKPVWTLLSFVPDWRWLLDRGDSPWYLSMRLFRQPSLGDWESVISKIKDELLLLLGKT